MADETDGWADAEKAIEQYDTDDVRPANDDAMAVYSADGQADDETGNDAGAEALRDSGEATDPSHIGPN